MTVPFPTPEGPHTTNGSRQMLFSPAFDVSVSVSVGGSSSVTASWLSWSALVSFWTIVRPKAS